MLMVSTLIMQGLPCHTGALCLSSTPLSSTPLSSTPRPDLTLRRLMTEASLDLSRIHRALTDHSEAMLITQGLDGVTPAQSGALMVLFQARRPLSGRQVADALGLTEVTTGRFLRALEAAGWVRRARDPADARALLVEPTPAAYDALPRFIAVSNGLLDRAFAGFTEAEIEALVTAVRRVEGNLRG